MLVGSSTETRTRWTATTAGSTSRRFGREFLDYAIGPFVSGVYAGDPELLSLRSAFPPMYEFERDHGGVIKGALRTAKARKARNAARGKTGPARLVSFDGGMEVMTRALSEGRSDPGCGARRSRSARGLLESLERSLLGTSVQRCSAQREMREKGQHRALRDIETQGALGLCLRFPQRF